VSNVTSPAVSNVTSPAVSNLTIQQPTSQIQAPNENSRSEPICCKAIGHSGGSSNNGEEIASASEDKEEVESVSTASFVGTEDKDEAAETATEDEAAETATEDEAAETATEDEAAETATEDEAAETATEDDNQNFQDDFTLDDFLGNNYESNDWSDSMGFALQNEIMNEVESDLQSAGININLN
jgi:hypothetical protein